MGVIIYSFNLNISPKMLYGVLECGIVTLQSYMLVIFVIKKGTLFVRDPVYIFICVISKKLFPKPRS